MDAIEKFRKQTEIKMLLNDYNGDIELVAKTLKCEVSEITELVNKDEQKSIRETCMLSLEKHLHRNAAKGDTKAAEILLAAHYPEMYDARIRYDAWKNKGTQVNYELPELEFHVIPKSDDDLPVH